MTCERSLLPRADGSARWTAGGTVATAAVYGPAATSARVEDPEAAVVRATWRPAPEKGGAAGLQPPSSQHPAARALEAALAGAVRAALVAEAAPRTAVLVDVTVEADDGGAAAAGFNAAAAALADAGGCVPLKALPAAATVALAADGTLLVDPTAAEAAAAAGVATFTFLTRGQPGADGSGSTVLSLVGGGDLAGAAVDGRFTDDQVADAVAVAGGAALAAAEFNRAGLAKAFGMDGERG
jgi:exosome complex component RRP46